VRDEQTHPHRPRLVVSHSTCPALSSSPPANSFVIGPAVINTHSLSTAFVRSKAKILQQDVQKLRIVPDLMIHYALLRFCQHTRLAFLARNVPPAILMQPVDVNFDPASGVRIGPVAVPVFIQDLIELPHHEGGLGITPLPASGMAAFYSATANLVSWLGSLPHASQWVAGQTLDDPTTWLCSALTTLKQLHGKL